MSTHIPRMSQRRYLTGEEAPEPSPRQEIEVSSVPRLPHAGRIDPNLTQAHSSKLLGYWQILRRRKGTILLAAFLGALVGLLIALPQTPVYRSHATLEIQPVNENLLNTQQIDPNASGLGYSSEAFVRTQVKLLQSESLIQRVLTKLKLDKPGSLNQPGRLSVWRKALGLPQPEPESEHQQALSMASNSLTVRVLPMTHVVELLSDSINPRLAAAFVNTLASEFIDHSMEVRWKAAQHTGDWLTRQLEDLKIKLEKSEEQLQSYAVSAGLMFTGEKDSVSIDEEKLKQLQEELSKAQAKRMTKQSQYGITLSSTPESLAGVLESDPLREYQAKLTDLRRELAELRTSFKPAHYKVQQVQAQLDELQAAMAKERADIVSRLRNDYEASRHHEKLLADAYAEQSRRVSNQASESIHYNILKREADTNRQLYEVMLQKVKEYGIASAMRANNTRVVDEAKRPSLPYKPDLLQSSVRGSIAGLFLGLVFIFMRERADRSLQAPGDAPLYLNLPELGAIPSAKADSPKRLYGRTQPAMGPPSMLPPSILPGDTPETGRLPSNISHTKGGRNGKKPECVELVTWQRKPSLLAESFRTTLASILFSSQNGNRPRAIVLTSCNPTEGKTTVTCNLGIALAEIGHRVLVVDGDLRKPRLHQLFDLPNTWGLTDLLRETNPVDKYPLETLAKKTEIPRLYVLPSGPATESISNLLFSTRLPQLLDRFRREFDSVLIDSPPMLQISDARILGRLADGVILVFRANHTKRDMALTVAQRLQEDRTQILGTVLNQWEPHRTEGYGDYNRYSHYYSSSEKRE